MSAKRNRPNAGGGIPASSSEVKSTAQVGQKPTVIARAVVVSGRDRDRIEFDVTHCPRCGQLHRHRAPMDWLGGARTSPCGLRYAVVLAMPARVAA